VHANTLEEPRRRPKPPGFYFFKLWQLCDVAGFAPGARPRRRHAAGDDQERWVRKAR